LETGLVIKSTGSWFTVRMQDGLDIDCKIKGTFRTKGIRNTNPVAVGDHVKIIVEKDYGIIREIVPRKNYIIRKSPNLSKETQIIASNIDQALLVITLVLPKLSTEFIAFLLHPKHMKFLLFWFLIKQIYIMREK